MDSHQGRCETGPRCWLEWSTCQSPLLGRWTRSRSRSANRSLSREERKALVGLESHQGRRNWKRARGDRRCGRRAGHRSWVGGLGHVAVLPTGLSKERTGKRWNRLDQRGSPEGRPLGRKNIHRSILDSTSGAAASVGPVTFSCLHLWYGPGTSRVPVDWFKKSMQLFCGRNLQKISDKKRTGPRLSPIHFKPT